MKQIIKYICIFLSYFFYGILITSLIKIIGIDISTKSLLFKNIYLFLSDLIYLIIIFMLTKKDLIKDFKNFKLELFAKYLPIYVIGLILMGISNGIIINITGIELSSNEESVRNMIKVFPIYMFYSSVIDAPFIEEIIFRKCFRKIFNNNLLFILISGITFGLIHIISNGNESINEILMGIPYIIMGIDFAYIYYKSKNIFTTMTIHAMHNLILIIIQYIGG